ncbi:uncharacterized protein LOC113990481 [Pipra filicauda]|uniref:Uncharacterized protein LOC113990481 n=1 Tax=Pipra filicauda TaxID=649802 RepID=A0A6J2H2L0_9PASS|nr:uncharacterized protein LOC113990481 [Pipra filicauda]
MVLRKITAPAMAELLLATSTVEWCSAGHRQGTNTALPQQCSQWLRRVFLCTARSVGRVFQGPPAAVTLQNPTAEDWAVARVPRSQPAEAIFKQTLGRERQVLQHPSSGHPSLPSPPEGAARRAGTALLTHRTTSSFPIPPPASCQVPPCARELPGVGGAGPQCGRAAMAAVPPPPPRGRSSAVIKELPVGLASAAAAVPPRLLRAEGAEQRDKSASALSQLSLCSAGAAAAAALPPKQPLRCGHQGVQTPHTLKRAVIQPS